MAHSNVLKKLYTPKKKLTFANVQSPFDQYVKKLNPIH